MHPRDQEAFNVLATRYLSGEATSEERERLANCLKDPAYNEWFNALQRGWDVAKPAPVTGFSAQSASVRLTHEIACEREEKTRSASHGLFTLRFSAWLTLAAALIVAIAGTTWIVRAHRENPAALAWTQRTTALGERMTVTLQDGTKVTLNGASTLSYPAAFDHYTRVVRLTGEAFFDVAHEEGRPFVVETSALRTTVLGTHFNVAAYSADPASAVSLVEGRVQVLPLQTAHEVVPLVLAPGQQYTFNPASGESRVVTFDLAAVTGWMHDDLVFQGEPLASAARKLSRRFGVPVTLAPALAADQAITGHFEKESLQEVCEILHLTGEVDFRINQRLGHIESVELLPARADAPPR